MPTAMAAALPKGTVQYGCEIVGASLTHTGVRLLALVSNTVGAMPSHSHDHITAEWHCAL